MAINLELPRKLEAVIAMGHKGAAEIFRPISRKYDLNEHAYPVELDTIATLFEGITAAKTISFAGTEAFRDADDGPKGNINGANMSALLNALEVSWGDVALVLSIPRQGLGNAAISGVATNEQLERLGKGIWAAMAITEPSFGSDSAAVSTTAVLDGDEYVINGEKIYVTAGSRASHIVVWATLDKSKGRAAIKSFVVPREHPGVTIERLEHKLGIKASDTAAIRFENVRIPKDNLLGSPEIQMDKGFAGVMETFDNTRPIVAAMAVGVARAALEDLREILTQAGIEISYDKPAHAQSAAAEFVGLPVAAVHPQAGVVGHQPRDLHHRVVALPRRIARRAPHVGGLEAAGVAHRDVDQTRPPPLGGVEEARQRGGVDELVRVPRGQCHRGRTGHRQTDGRTARRLDLTVGRQPGRRLLGQEGFPLVGLAPGLAAGGPIPVGVEAGLSAHRHRDRDPRVQVPLERRGVDVPAVEVILSPQAVEQPEVRGVGPAALELNADVVTHTGRRDVQVFHRQARARERTCGGSSTSHTHQAGQRRRSYRCDRDSTRPSAQLVKAKLH